MDIEKAAAALKKAEENLAKVKKQYNEAIQEHRKERADMFIQRLRDFFKDCDAIIETNYEYAPDADHLYCMAPSDGPYKYGLRILPAAIGHDVYVSNTSDYVSVNVKNTKTFLQFYPNSVPYFAKWKDYYPSYHNKMFDDNLLYRIIKCNSFSTVIEIIDYFNNRFFEYARNTLDSFVKYALSDECVEIYTATTSGYTYIYATDVNKSCMELTITPYTVFVMDNLQSRFLYNDIKHSIDKDSLQKKVDEIISTYHEKISDFTKKAEDWYNEITNISPKIPEHIRTVHYIP